MTPMRFSNITRAILSTLEGGNLYPYPEVQLLDEINGVIRPPVGNAAFDEAMLFLNSRKFIVTVPSALDANLVQWTITESGKAALRQ